MKKIVLTMVALLSMTAAVAQSNDTKKEFKAPKKPTPEEMTNRMAKDLSLTDQQKAQVLALNKEYEKVLGGPGMRRGPRPQKSDVEKSATEQAPKAKPQGERPERPQLSEAQKAEMKQNMEKRKEYDIKLKKILNDKQYENYQKMYRRGFGGPHGHHGGPRPDKAPQK